MVSGQANDFHVDGFYFSEEPGGNVEHMANHDVTPLDVVEVWANAPKYFYSRTNRNASYVMIGPNGRGRFLFVPLAPTVETGIWAPATAYWMNARRARRLYGGP